MGALSQLQWPAMAATVLATWLVASTQERRRKAGFWLFLSSNLLWAVWAIHDEAPALLALQLALAALNVRGAQKAAAQARAAAATVPASASATPPN